MVSTTLNKAVLAIIGVLLVVISVISLYPVSRETIAQQLPREKTLYIAGITTAFGNSYNPFAWNAPGVDLVIMPLFVYNFVVDKWYPGLANWTWVNDTVLEIRIFPEAKWEDGVPVTADDIIFTYEEAIKTRCSDILYWCSGLYAPRSAFFVKWEKIDAKTVRLYINSTAIRAYRRIPWIFAGWVKPAPAHIFRTINSTLWIKTPFNDPAKGWPVGNGPYRVKYFDPAMVILERKDDWWGWKYVRDFGIKVGVLKPDEPYPTDSYPPKYIVWVTRASADLARASLIAGEVDIIGTVVPGLDAYKKQGLGAWYDKPPYYSPYAAWTAFIQHIPPLTIPEVKRAVFLAINREAIASKISFGFAAAPSDPIGFPDIAVYKSPPFYNFTWIKETFKSIYGVDWPLNYTKAKAVARDILSKVEINGTRLFMWDDTKKRFVWATDITLKGPGITMTFKKGDVLTLTAIVGAVPSTDDAAALDQIRRDLADIGIELNILLSPSSWDDFRIGCKGHFHFATYFIAFTPGPTQAAIPGQLGFVDARYNRTHTIWDLFPCGKAPPWNPGRYNNLVYSYLLENLTRVKLTDIENNTKIIRLLLEQFLKDPPFIALAVVPIGVTYSTQWWTGYPTAANPSYGTPWYDFAARSGWYFYLFLKPAPRPGTPTVTVTIPTTIVTPTIVTTTRVQTITTVMPTTFVTTVSGVPTTIYTTAVQTIERPVTVVQPTTVVVTVTPTPTPVAVIPEWVIPTIVVLIIIIAALGFLLIRRR